MVLKNITQKPGACLPAFSLVFLMDTIISLLVAFVPGASSGLNACFESRPLGWTKMLVCAGSAMFAGLVVNG